MWDNKIFESIVNNVKMLDLNAISLFIYVLIKNLTS